MPGWAVGGEKPLLLKLSANLTPFGTMIFIPAYWSFDPKRDLKWKEITALHKVRGVQKQGPKLAKNKLELEREAARTKRLWTEAGNKGLKGASRTEWVMGKLGWDPRNDESRLRRLLKSGR